MSLHNISKDQHSWIEDRPSPSSTRNEPSVPWKTIVPDLETVVRLDGQYEVTLAAKKPSTLPGEVADRLVRLHLAQEVRK